MQCPNCGNILAEGAVFCDSCGSYCPAPTSGSGTSPNPFSGSVPGYNPIPNSDPNPNPNPFGQQSYNTNGQFGQYGGFTPPPPPKKSKNPVLIIVIVLAVLIVVGGVITAIALSGNSGGDVDTNYSYNDSSDSDTDSGNDIGDVDNDENNGDNDNDYNDNDNAALDTEELNRIVNSSACSNSSICIYNINDEVATYEYDSSDEHIASALVIFPTIYTIGQMIDNGELEANDECTFHYYNEGRTSDSLTRDCDGDAYTIDDLICHSLNCSDNNAINSLMSYVGFDKINETCHDAGFYSVQINKLVAEKSSEDNYISAYDLAKMVSDMFTRECAASRFSQFMLECIHDDYGTIGFASDSSVFKSFNGYTGKIYDEVAFFSNDRSTYVVTILSEEDSYEDGAGLARSIAANF